MGILLRINILTLLCVVPFAVLADEWQFYSPFAGVEGMAETKGRVYFISAGSLFAYDKDNDETITFNETSGLHDNDVNGVFSPSDGNFVVVTYTGGNIDIIRDNGKILNLPDIKDADIEGKTVNAVAFSPDRSAMIVATDFGIVRFDLSKMEVIDSGIYNMPVYKIGYLGSMPVMYLEDGRMLMLTDESSIRDPDTWNELDEMAIVALMNYGETLYGILWHDSILRPVKFSYDEEALGHLSYCLLGTESVETLVIGDSTTPVIAVNGESVSAFDSDGKTVASFEIPEGIGATALTVAEGIGNFWIGNRQGISNAEVLSGDIYIGTAICPGEMSVKTPHILRMGSSGELYIGNRGNSNVFYELTTGFRGYQAKLASDGTFTDLTPSGLSDPHFHSPSNREDFLYDVLFIREDPDDPSVYYTGDLYSGFYALSSGNGGEIIHYSPLNSPLTDYWGIRVMDVAVDPRGYLWILSERDPGLPSLMALSPEGRAKGNSVTEEDWTVAESTANFSSGRDGMIEMSPDGRFLYLMGSTDLFVYDTKSTADFSDDTGSHITGFKMNDGSGSANFSRLCTIKVDPSDGALWVGTFEGVFRAPEPWKVSNGSIEIIKPKVPRDDGTGLADYLLSTEKVYDIAVDPTGHKWFATAASGVFMTSADGTSIINTFTSSNSPLPSDCVYAVECDFKGSDKVYFGTTCGLLEYRSGYSAPGDDYSAVKIYPNPVRPDYYGPVTIEGLVDGSEVRILSASGALVAVLGNEGGTVRWDAMSGGKRLPSGIYYVLASSEKHSGKPVGKIIIVR